MLFDLAFEIFGCNGSELWEIPKLEYILYEEPTSVADVGAKPIQKDG